MTYKSILELLLDYDVYKKIKENEDEILKLIPELKKCKGFKQNNEWHIFDVYEHILHTVTNVESNIYLRLAALFHDIGKPITYIEDENGIGHFYNHWNKSIDIFNKYYEKLELNEKEFIMIKNLIFYHDINIEKMSKVELDKMINIIGVENLYLLFQLKKADLLAQSPQYHYLISNIDNQEKNLIFKKK